MSCFLANPFSFATRKERIRMIRYGLCFKTVAVNSGGDPCRESKILQGAFPTCPIYSSTQRPSQPFPQVPNVRPPSKAKLCQAKATWRLNLAKRWQISSSLKGSSIIILIVTTIVMRCHESHEYALAVDQGTWLYPSCSWAGCKRQDLCYQV